MAHAVTSLVISHGMLAVLVLMTLESCGVPFPSEVLMPVGGALAAAGYALGSSYDRVSGPIGRVALGVGLCSVAGVGVWLYRGRASALEGSGAL